MQKNLNQSFLIVFFLLSILLLFTFAGCDPSTDQKGSRIFVSVAGDNEVVEIDEKKGTVVAHIPVGKGPAIILATPDGAKLYTANWGDNSITAIETNTGKTTQLGMSGRPYVIAMAPDGDLLYAGLYSNEIAVIDTAADTIVKSFPTPELPASLFVSPDGKILYVAITDAVPGNIRAVSTETGEIVHDAINVGIAPGWITMSPNGSKVYALNYYSDDISVVDTAGWTVEASIFTGKGSKAIIGSVSPDNKTLYVTNLGTANLMAVDTRTNEVYRTTDLDGRPIGVSLNKKGSRVYVTDSGPESLEVTPTTTFLETGVYTPTYGGQVSIFSTKSGKLISKIKVGPGPTSVTAIPSYSFNRKNFKTKE